MSKLRDIKVQVVKDITTKIKDSKSTFFVEYLGLTVAELTKLRNELRSEGVELKVYKNRLVKLAAKEAGYGELDSSLIGPNIVAFSSQDEIAGARIIAEHAKKLEQLKFKAGIFEGKVVDAAMVTELSQIPSRETLLTQIAAGLLQPLQQIAIGLNMLEESHVSGAGSAPETKAEETSAPAAEATVEEQPTQEAKEAETSTENATEEKAEEAAE